LSLLDVYLAAADFMLERATVRAALAVPRFAGLERAGLVTALAVGHDQRGAPGQKAVGPSRVSSTEMPRLFLC
jgi:hypothetical protein